MRLLFGTLRLGFLLKNNPFLEKEAATTLQYVGYTSPLNMSGNPAMSVPLYRHNGAACRYSVCRRSRTRRHAA